MKKHLPYIILIIAIIVAGAVTYYSKYVQQNDIREIAPLIDQRGITASNIPIANPVTQIPKVDGTRSDVPQSPKTNPFISVPRPVAKAI